MPEFTQKQSRVIDAPINNILVSAAAGSGKTTVLVQRIIEKIQDKSLSIDRVLVVTFTNAAASNMKEKIDKAIKRAIKNNPDDREYLKGQLDMLPNAYIQTLNSFCNRVIKEKGYELVSSNLTLEPNMMILSEQELKLMLRRAVQEAIDSKYLDIVSEGEDQLFTKTLNYMTNGRDDQNLVDCLVEIYPRLRSLPNYLDVISNLYKERINRDERRQVHFLEQFNAKIIKLYDYARTSACSSYDVLDSIIFNKSDNEGHQSVVRGVLEVVIEESTRILNLSDSEVPQEEIFIQIKNSLATIAGCDDIFMRGRDPSVKYFKNLFGPAAALIGLAKGHSVYGFSIVSQPYSLDSKYSSFLQYSIEELLELQAERTGIVGVIVDLIESVDANYSRLKRRFHAMDFSDQEQFAYNALSEQTVCDYYRDKFVEIYVDEYQDNSTLQDAIIRKFSNDNVFMVGDVKQSIYRFRYANPNMFIDKMERYQEVDGGGVLYDLNNNFRSSPEILDFVNILFEQLMTKDTEIDYDDSHKLYPSPNAVRSGSVPSVVIVNNKDVNEDETFDDEEANSSTKLDFKGVCREVVKYQEMGYELGDICILTRKREASRRLAQMLRKRGIKAVCPEVKTIYDDPDIATLCSLITLLSNEHRDECLVGVLLAGYRFGNFTLEEIGKITLYAKRNDLLYMNLIVKIRFFANLKSVDAEDESLHLRAKRFIATFDELRTEAIVSNIGELVESIYSKTGIKATLKEKGDEQKLIVFKNWLCETYMSRGEDISSIGSSLEDLKLRMGKEATIEFESQQGDAIQCMTYHKSKGLEFKCVIVTNLKYLQQNDSSDMIVFDERRGFLCNDYDDDSLVRSTSFERLMYEEDMRLAELSETIRLLYVAFTRAENHLSIVTNVSFGKNPKDKCELIYRMLASQNETKFDREFILRSKNMNMIFLSSVLRLSGARDFLDYIEEGSRVEDSGICISSKIDFDDFVLDFVDSDSIDVPSDDDLEEEELIYEEIDADINDEGLPEFTEYLYEDSVSRPSKTSVSELNKEEQRLKFDTSSTLDEADAKLGINMIVPDLQYFSNEESFASSSSRGSLIHDLLRYLDFVSIYDKISSGIGSKDALADEIKYLRDNGIIDDKKLEVIEEFKANLYSFVTSELFERMAKAEKRKDSEFEKPIMFALSLPNNTDYTIVQGVIDVLFYEDGEAVVVDYKTDRINEDDEEVISSIVRERHGLQLDMYASALEAAGIIVKEKIVWLVRKGIEIRI